jgi:hypothetical protein
VLGSSPETSPTIVIVIDALDKCGGPKVEEDVDLILQLLAKAKDLAKVRLRVCITSRPESYIWKSFGDVRNCVYYLDLHDIDKRLVNNNISAFLKHELKEIQKKHLLPANWLGEKDIVSLIRRADSLFIYAATACRFIRCPNLRIMQKRLLSILNSKTDRTSFTQDLDHMYTQIVKQSIVRDYDEEENEMLSKDFQLIVGTLVKLCTSLLATAIGELCLVEVDRVNSILYHLHSVLVVLES